MSKYNTKTPINKKRISLLRANFERYGSSNKQFVIDVSAKQLGISSAGLSTMYYTLCRQGVKFYENSDGDETIFPIIPKVIKVQNDNNILNEVLNKLPREVLISIINKLPNDAIIGIIKELPKEVFIGIVKELWK